MGWGVSYEGASYEDVAYEVILWGDLMGHLITREGCTDLPIYINQLAYVIPNKLSKKEPQSLSSSDNLGPSFAQYDILNIK